MSKSIRLLMFPQSFLRRSLQVFLTSVILESDVTQKSGMQMLQDAKD